MTLDDRGEKGEAVGHALSGGHVPEHLVQTGAPTNVGKENSERSGRLLHFHLHDLTACVVGCHVSLLHKNRHWQSRPLEFCCWSFAGKLDHGLQ